MKNLYTLFMTAGTNSHICKKLVYARKWKCGINIENILYTFKHIRTCNNARSALKNGHNSVRVSKIFRDVSREYRSIEYGEYRTTQTRDSQKLIQKAKPFQTAIEIFTSRKNVPRVTLLHRPFSLNFTPYLRRFLQACQSTNPEEN